ncbi:MAG: helix-turn-helix transcriptional regulator [Niastella sp.]|nr:helix-turn-helix transcriptional regulator [Niastella sp.]
MAEKVTILKALTAQEFSIVFGGEQPAGFDPVSHYKPFIHQYAQLAIGPFFWFIADTVRGMAYDAGGDIDGLWDFTQAQLANHPPVALFQATHPDDLPKMLAFSKFMTELWAETPAEKRYTLQPTIYLRLRSLQKDYHWCMVQMTYPISDSLNRLLYCITLVTRISHIRSEGSCFMSIKNVETQVFRCYYCDSADQQITSDESPLPRVTRREKDVLRLLGMGYSSKQIAGSLGIAVKTVDNNRQNLLKKLAAKSSPDMIAKAVKAGLI